MTDFPVLAGGVLHPPLTPVVPAEDHGFQLGLAVFETLLVEDGHAYFLDRHIARLLRGADRLAMEHPTRDGEKLDVLAESALESVSLYLEAVTEPRFILRLTLSRGVPGHGWRLILTARDFVAPEDTPGGDPSGVTAMLSPYLQLADGLADIKSTSRLRLVLGCEEARVHGAWEALFVNSHGMVTEGSITNLFLHAGGTLQTPPIDVGCLGGIIRGLVLEAIAQEPLDGLAGEPIPLLVQPISVEELWKADEVFLTHSTGVVVPVRRLTAADRVTRELPGSKGPVQAAIRSRLLSLESHDRSRK